MPIRSSDSVIEADLDREDHQRAVLDMISAYALDPMGAGKPIPNDTREKLIEGLRGHPTTLVFLAYDGDDPVGIAVCFRGFSTFQAKPLINIHDLSVIPTHRGRGIGRKLLDAVERKAQDTGCCKLTLEVVEHNHRARGVYETAGFCQAEYAEAGGGALFYAKSLQA